MEDNFNQNDFEEFLKEQVRNHRMYPADTVWRDINKKLHGDKKWPALTIAAFILLSATIAICVHFTPKPDIFATKPSEQLKDSTLAIAQHNNVLNNLPSSTSLYREKNFPALQDKLTENSPNSTPVPVINYIKLVIDRPETLTTKEREDKKVVSAQIISISKKKATSLKIPNSHIVLNSNAENRNDAEYVNLPHDRNEIITSKEIKRLEENPKAVKDFSDKNIVDRFLKDRKNDLFLHTYAKQKSLKNKFGFQIYVAPSISYRKLLEDRSMLEEGTNTGPVGLNYVTDVNSVVRHRPGNGIEAGLSIMYNMTNKFRLKTGLQFNVRQYSIEAYRSNTEVASIALIGDHGVDTVNTVAVYRNNNGYYSAELVNRYYQLAVPIGVEWEIVGNKTIQLNVAGSIQPTYLINRNAYFISTNFKNYSENPEMVRSFNVNSNIETFISFKVGDFKWQLGPQLRYQPYSTFIRQYPIKEHLMDYGIKIGLSKTFN